MGALLSCLQDATVQVQQSLEDHQQQSQQDQHEPTTSASPQSKLSAVSPSLPSGAEKQQVRNVYDGDTLTLVNEKRVRFLGIDTPEIKEKQPFAQEAKAYTKDLVDNAGKHVWLSYEPDGDKEDHYGRLLAFVWVKNNDGYLCINEGIVLAGLAAVYKPRKDSKLSNFSKMIAMQKDARSHKRGLWSTFVDSQVTVTPNGSAYHESSCSHLSKSKNVSTMKASEASDKGLHPCRTCMS
jgi:micrococcal nuclease